MSLGDQLLELRNRTLAEFRLAHDYYAESVFLWNTARNNVDSGWRFSLVNSVTGTITTPVELAVKANGYITTQLAQATFGQFLAIFESFVFELLRLWLTAYPQSLAGKKLEFRSVLELPDREAITDAVVRKELIELLYDRPTGWFTYLDEKAKLGCPSADDIAVISEAKATRDVLVHNQGVVNALYVAKAGRLARYAVGERIDLPDKYHRLTWERLSQIVSELADAARAKAGL